MTAAATAATAAGLSADDERRAARLLTATDLTRSPATSGAPAPPRTRCRRRGLMRDAVLGQLLTYELRPAEAQAVLDRAWERCDAEADPALAARIARATVHHHLVRLRAQAALPWADRVLRYTPDDPGRAFGHWSRALALTALGEGARAETELSDALAGAPQGAALPLRVGRGWIRLARDDFAGARDDLAAAASAAWEARSLELACLALAHLARAEYATGRWDDALVAAGRAQALVAEVETVPALPFVWWSAALVPSARGDEPAVDAQLAALERRPLVFENLVAGAALARAHAYAVRGEHERVVAALEPLLAIDPRDVVDEPGFLPWQALYAGALVALGAWTPLARSSPRTRRAPVPAASARRSGAARGSAAGSRPRAATPPRPSRRSSRRSRSSPRSACRSSARSRSSRSASCCAGRAAAPPPRGCRPRSPASPRWARARPPSAPGASWRPAG